MSNDDAINKVQIRELAPDELAELIRTVQSDPKPPPDMDAAMDTLKKEGWLPWWIWPELTGRKAEFIPKIVEIFENTEATDLKRKLEIASYLVRLGSPRGLDYIIAQLRNPDPQARWRALYSWNDEAAPSPRNRAEQELLLSLLYDSNKDIRALAVGKCGANKMDGVIPAFEQLLQEEDCPVRSQVVSWLLQFDPFDKHLDMALEFFKRCGPDEDVTLALGALENIAESGPPILSAKARAGIEDFFVNSQNKFKYNQQNARVLWNVGSERALPGFVSIVQHAADSVSRHYALDAIARLKPSRAVELLSSCLDHWALSRDFLRAFQTSATEQDWNALARLVLDGLAAKRKNLYFTDPIVDLLLEHGKEAGRSLVMAELPQLHWSVQMHATWKLKGWTVEAMLENLKNHGLIESVPDRSLVEKVRQENPNLSEAALFPEVLLSANILCGVFPEKMADEGFPNHCHLLAKFSEMSDGMFKPEYCRQVTIIRPVDGVDEIAAKNRERAAQGLEPFPLEEESYQVSFIVGNRLFQFEAMDFDEHYDMGAVATAVNAALNAASKSQRFVEVRADSHLILYFLGEPEKFRRFCAAYAIPL